MQDHLMPITAVAPPSRYENSSDNSKAIIPLEIILINNTNHFFDLVINSRSDCHKIHCDKNAYYVF